MATWLVTGANRGIGLGLVQALAQRGETVLAGTRHPEEARALSDVAEGSQGRVRVLALDVTDPATIKAAAQATVGQPVHVLINNAGVYGPDRQGALDIDPDAFLHTLAVNTVGPFRVLQAFRSHLETAGRGAKVVTISSTMGSFASGGTGTMAYRASKAAVNRAVLACAGELSSRGITSVVMHPGWVRTDMGGGGADLSVEQAVRGILRTIDGLNPSDSGRFFNWDGRPASW